MDIFTIISLSLGVVTFLIATLVALFGWTANNKITAHELEMKAIEKRGDEKIKSLKDDINSLNAKYDRLDIELRAQQNDKYEEIMKAIAGIDNKIGILQTEVSHLKGTKST